MFLKRYGFLLAVLIGAAILVGKYLYKQPKFINGEVAPNIETNLISGEAFELSDLKGSYVLLDFWGTWCGPCRAEFPELRALHEKYKDKTFKNGGKLEVVSVALETSTKVDRLAKEIEKQGLAWKYHILDPINSALFDAAIATKLYGVREIPTKYLINPEGYIVGVNLSYEEMSNILEKAL